MRRPLRYAIRLLIAIVLTSAQMPVWAETPAVESPPSGRQLETEEARARAGGRVTVGGRVGESVADGYLDVLQPLAGGRNSVLFLNPKLSGSDSDEEEMSIGLGLRVMCPSVEAIAGLNVFYDSRRTSHDNTFDQVGAGLEVLTSWVDARANYYLPDDKQERIERVSDTDIDQERDYSLSDVYGEGHQLLQLERTVTRTTTTTRYFDRFEAALEGYDAEVGVRLPYLPGWLETRIFAGYYAFEGDFTDDIEGFRGRLEVRALPALTLDAELYENDTLAGSDYFVGARVNVPFDATELARGRNPFAGTSDQVKLARRAFRDRLSEMVIRDPNVRIHESDYIEDEPARIVDVDTDVDENELLVLDDVNFVNNRNTGFENGTDEHPWNTVQEGVSAVFGDRNVYVYQGAAAYRENVKIAADGVKLLGEGVAIPGYGGHSFGGDRYPQLDGNVGGVNGPVVRVTGDDVWIQGFEITRTPGGVNPGNTDGLGLGLPIDEVGILAENADNLTVFRNRINSQSYGIVGLHDPTEPGAPADLNLQILDNLIEGSDYGVFASGSGAGGRFSALVQRNTFGDIGVYDVAADFPNFDHVELNILQNRFLDADAYVYASFGVINDDALVNVAGNRFEQGGAVSLTAGSVLGDAYFNVTDNDFLGISLITMLPGSVGGNSTILIDRNYMADGIIVAIQGPVAGDSWISVSGNTIPASGGGAITLIGGPVSGKSSLFVDDNAIGAVNGGGITAILGPTGDDLYASISGNSILGASGGGVTLVGGLVTGDAAYEFSDNVVAGNQGAGFTVALGPTGGDLDVQAAGNDIVDNLGAGLTLSAASVGGDARIAILNSSFDDNGGVGLSLSVPFVGGTLDVLIDPTTANRNSGGGMNLGLGSVGNLAVTLEDVTANDNAGPGLLLSANSISGSVHAALLDVEASRNGGGGISANFGANQDLILGRVLPAVEGNRIVANDNTGLGVLITGNSVSGQVISLTQRMETSGNIGGGSSRDLQAPESVNVVDAEVVANGNIGPGMSLVAESTNNRVLYAVGWLEASGNFGGGANILLSGLDSVSAFLGVPSPLPVLPFPAQRGLVLNNNIGGGLSVTLDSLEGGAGALLGETEANGNIGNGLAFNISAREQAALFMGLADGSLTNGTANVVANNNLGNGISANLFSASGDANLMLLGDGSANNNLGSGVQASLVAGGEVGVGIGTTPFAFGRLGSFEASGNDLGSGLALSGVSTGSAVRIILAGVTANSNALDGITVQATALDDVQFVVGSYLGPEAGPVTAIGNGDAGLRLAGSSVEGGAFAVVSDVEASRNAGQGVAATLAAQDDITVVLGLGSDGGTNVFVLPVVANHNGGSGIELSATSSLSSVELAAVAFVANSNNAAGLRANLSAYSNAFSAVGGLGGLLPFTVTGSGQAISNGLNGLELNLASTAGSVTAVVADVTANQNLGDGANIQITAADGITAALRDSTFNQNDDAGFRLQYAAGTSEFVVVENVQANGNGGANRAQSLGGSDVSSELLVRDVEASGNGGVGLIAHALSDGTATVVVENVTANSNFQGLDLYARASGGSAFVSMSNVVANNNTTIGVEGDALAAGGNAQIRVRDVTANNNGTYGVELLAENSGASEARVIVSGDLAVNNNQTGALFVAKSDGTAVVLFNLNNSVSASNNANHGIVGAAEGDFGSVSLSAGFVPAVNNNGNYGLVALAVGTNGTFANALNPSGTGNGSGNDFDATANVGPWEPLLP